MKTKIKTCAKCKTSYPATADYFYKCNRYKDGLEYTCKECRKISNRKWNKEHPDKRKAANKKYRGKYYSSQKLWRLSRTTNRQCWGLHQGKRCTRRLEEGYYKRCRRCVDLENPVLDENFEFKEAIGE